jgi:UDP-N-acetylmuramoyl-L-alanyl-D-glutamate--2,6-diaminopimelate ligase
VVDRRYAAEHGAVAGATTIVVPDTRRALSRLAAAFFAYPARSLLVVGVTGTNGKTTTTHLIDRILATAGLGAGRVGTLGAAFGDATWPLSHTTPLALELHALLAAMRERGAKAVVMEVSSHALVLDRVTDVPFAIGVLTNITRDHLDFHSSFDAYVAAKRSLFELARRAVLNADDACGLAFARTLGARTPASVTYGFGGAAQVRAGAFETRAEGSTFEVDGRRFRLRLPGRFNVSNALAALCVARLLGVDDATSAAALETFDGVAGRMERFAGAGIDVLVDYAHTPDALAAVLGAARELSARRLIVVFGCGGDRDRGKRPQMGRIACELADRVVLTSDNPRGEEPAAIVADIMAGAGAGEAVAVEPDRRAAIRGAVLAAQPGDVVVVAGKGHETYQLTGDARSHFDDREEVRAALAARAAATT